MMFNITPQSSERSNVEPDLYFLIARFLSQGPCQQSAQMLIKEIEQNGLNHQSLDWNGRLVETNFENRISNCQTIASDHLLQICLRAAKLLDTEMPPPMKGRNSLLGVGRYSLLRTKESVQKTLWSFSAYAADIAKKPLVIPHNFQSKHNWARSISGREYGGSKFPSLIKPSDKLFGKIKLHRRILGHLSSVYCVLFDRTGARIFTGSDDCLVKCWSSRDGRLLSTFRGHQSEICDMDVSHENTILASGSCDKEIRIWDLCSGRPLTILQSHSAMLTSIEFSPVIQGDFRYLISTGRDGNVCFWVWNVKTLQFASHPHKFQERNCPGVAMLCSSWSSGGRFLAVGGSDNLVHIYHIPLDAGNNISDPTSIAEQNEHIDAVDSLRFSHDGLRFVTGSKDGTARIWTYENAAWNSQVINVTFADPPPVVDQDRPSATTRSQTNASNKVCVIMVAWDCCDENVMTSLTNFLIKVWNSRTLELVSILKGHTNEAYCLEPHPTSKRIFLSAGHDGNVFLWDVMNGNIIMHFYNMLEGLGHGAVFDAKFSRDGNLLACTDSHGHLLLFGFGDGKEYQKMPEQQFFHTDYRPLVRDPHGYILDEQTQQAPHLMPPPFLVDFEGNPYGPEMQRMVPGREICTTSQLIPNLITGENGMPEVLPLENEDDSLQGSSHMNQDDANQSHTAQPARSNRSMSASSSVGLLREGHVAGVRQMHSNAPRSELASAEDIQALNQRVINPQFDQDELTYRNNLRRSHGHYELAWYKSEKRKQVKRRYSRDVALRYSTNPWAAPRRKTKARQEQAVEDSLESDSENSPPPDTTIRRRASGPVHRYSTRSNAPRRRDMITPSDRISTLTENVRNLDRESSSSDSVDSSSSVPSSEDNFSKKARILRRSKRKQALKKRGSEDENEDNDSIATSEESSDLNETSLERTESTAGSLFSPGIEKKGSIRKRRVRFTRNKRNRRLRSSSASLNQENEDSQSDAEEEVSTESSVNEDQPSTSSKDQTADSTSRKKQGSSKVINNTMPGIVPGEVLDMTPEWLTRCSPCQYPLVPQIGDEVVYLRQGHECYIEKIKEFRVWDVKEGDVCYETYPNIGVTEYCRVMKVEYHCGPPTLCEILLRPTMKKISKRGNQDFAVKYHDLPNSVDFIVLKQKFEKSISRSWQPNDRYRSIIDDMWWSGVIVKKTPFDISKPLSPFQCFRVTWDTEQDQGSYDQLSPWDIEPIPPNDNPERRNTFQTSNEVTSNGGYSTEERDTIDVEEMRKVISYVPRPGDWGDVDEVTESNGAEDSDSFYEDLMNRECNRIASGFEKLIEENLFSEFSCPVDVTMFPMYPYYISYPTDLSTMLKKLRNKFYRRSAGLIWEITCLKNNACIFNQPGTTIVQKAKFLSRLLHKFVKTKECDNILNLLENMKKNATETREQSDSSTENEKEGISSKRVNGKLRIYSSSEEDNVKDHLKWMEECKELLGAVMVMEDSRPFRNQGEDSDLMDLHSVREKLENNSYTDPKEFLSDIQLIFVNCKKHNTSRDVHSKSTRLSALMNSRIENIIQKWEDRKEVKRSRRGELSLRRSNRHKKSLRKNLNESFIYDSLYGKDFCKETKTVRNEKSGKLVPNKRPNGNGTLRKLRNYRSPEQDTHKSGNIQDNESEEKTSERSSDDENEDDSQEKTSNSDNSDESLNQIPQNKVKTRVKIKSVKRRRNDSEAAVSCSEKGSDEDLVPNRTAKRRRLSDSENESASENQRISDEEPHTRTRGSSSARNGVHEARIPKHARRPTFTKQMPTNHCQLRTTLNRPKRYGDYASDASSGDDHDEPTCSTNHKVQRSNRRRQLPLKARYKKGYVC